jgi:glycosyltransferase involved in cell wall biosynthesis
MSNVLYVVTHGEMGGVHRFLESVVLNHSENVRPVILSFREGAWLDELRRRELPVYCIDQARIRQPLRIFRAVRPILEREQIDIVHSSYAWCHTMVAPAARWSGCRSVWFHHGPMSASKWQGALQLVPADLVLANSHFMMDRFSKTFHRARRMGVVHYGIDAAAFAPDTSRREQFRRDWGLDESTIAIGVVGFIDTWKGQDIFLKAAKLLEARRGKIRMFIIGGPRDGVAESRCVAFERELRRYVAENHLEDFVHFTGHLDVNAGPLDGLDIFVHASTEPEPFGMSILEAMAKGKAIVASAEVGPLELIEHDREGLLIEPRQPELLATTIALMLDDPCMRARLGRSAMEAARTRFSPAAAVQCLEDWYRKLPGGKA